MSERLVALVLSLAVLIASPAAGEPASDVQIVDLPFKVTAIRGSDSEVALAIATSGILPIAKAKPASADPKAPPPPPEEAPSIAVVWGEAGGAVLRLGEGGLVTTLLGAEAIAGFAATETPSVAAPGSQRSVLGPITAYFSGALDTPGRAASLTIRERQPLAVASEPKAVPITTSTVAPEAAASFVAAKPKIAIFDGAPTILATTSGGDGTSRLAMIAQRDGRWTLAAQSPPQAGHASASLVVAAVADFLGNGQMQVAAVKPGEAGSSLQLWDLGDGALMLAAEAPGYAAPLRTDMSVLPAVLPSDRAGAANLAIVSADRNAIAVLSFKDGIAERARIALPAPAASGIAVLGRGRAARMLVALVDGRLASVTAAGGHP